MKTYMTIELRDEEIEIFEKAKAVIETQLPGTISDVSFARMCITDRCREIYQPVARFLQATVQPNLQNIPKRK